MFTCLHVSVWALRGFSHPMEFIYRLQTHLVSIIYILQNLKKKEKTFSFILVLFQFWTNELFLWKKLTAVYFKPDTQSSRLSCKMPPCFFSLMRIFFLFACRASIKTSSPEAQRTVQAKQTFNYHADQPRLQLLWYLYLPDYVCMQLLRFTLVCLPLPLWCNSQ